FLIIGGEDAAERNVYSEVDSYDPSTRRWSQLPSLPSGRQGIGAASIGDRLLVPGGGPTAGGGHPSAHPLRLAPTRAGPSDHNSQTLPPSSADTDHARAWQCSSVRLVKHHDSRTESGAGAPNVLRRLKPKNRWLRLLTVVAGLGVLLGGVVVGFGSRHD